VYSGGKFLLLMDNIRLLNLDGIADSIPETGSNRLESGSKIPGSGSRKLTENRKEYRTECRMECKTAYSLDCNSGGNLGSSSDRKSAAALANLHPKTYIPVLPNYSL